MRFTGLSEFAIYGLLFLAIVGFNLFKQIMTARREQARRHKRPAQDEMAGARRPEPLAELATREAELAQEEWGRPPEPGPVAMPAAVHEPVQPLEVLLASEMPEHHVAPAQPPRGRGRAARSGARHRLFRFRGELRHAIVLMTVLGPCRALQPYDQDHH